ncbi:MAG: carboxypeptidase regulatory-like domain-containing protein [Caldisericia bacterium]|nr:carboxypeptidase regulatory-like domain-containing protein [Caldisericia bacterium]
MKKNWIIIGSIILAILLVVTVAIILNGNKATKPNASLTGLVRNAKDSTVIADASVRIDSAETKTDKSGSFKLEGLSSGKYSIFIAADGFKPYEFPNYELKEGINKIDEIMLEIDDSKKTNPDDSAIIPPPPLPGTTMDKKPDFKKFSDLTNCTISLSIGQQVAGNYQHTVYYYSNGLTKIDNPSMSALDKSNPLFGTLYATKDSLITHPSAEQGWIAMPKPSNSPKFDENALPDRAPLMYIDSLFKAITDKSTTVNFIGKVNKEFGQANRYYVVADANSNLFDGEIFTPVDGKYKDTILEFSGRLNIGGIGDKTTLTITNISKTPAITLPQGIKTIEVPEAQVDQKLTKPEKNNP